MHSTEARADSPERRLLPFADQYRRNMAMVGWVEDLSGDDREAARRLFSILSHLEQIAVQAAEKGGGVEGQLDDELAHRETFMVIADRLGGHLPCPGSVQELTDFLVSLTGQASLACLNVVAEAWLETVFEHIAGWGPWQPLMAQIAAEEARHSHEALQAAKVDPEEALPLVRALEELLWQITVDPAFVWPLAWFGTIHGVAQMGQAALDRHAEACAGLGVDPGAFTSEIARCGAAGLDDQTPVKLELSPWEEGVAFPANLQPIGGHYRIRWRGSRRRRDVEAAVVRAVARVLAESPELNRTIVPARRELHRPVRPVVGLRFLHDGIRQVSTVYVPDGHTMDERGTRLALWLEKARTRGLPYRPPTVDPGLLRIAPANRCAVTITSVLGAAPPGSLGFSSLVPDEGCTWTLCLTSFERRWFRHHLHVFIGADHRAHNGREVGIFATRLKHYLERDR